VIGPHNKKVGTPDEKRAHVKEKGWDLFQSHWGSPGTLNLPEKFPNMEQSTYQHGQDPLWILHCAYCAVATPDPTKPRTINGTKHYLKRMIDHAAIIGASYLVLHSGGSKNKEPGNIIDEMRQFLTPLNDYCAVASERCGYPIKIAVEVPAHKYPFAQNMFHVATATNFSNTGWCLDLAHAWAAGVTYEHLLDVVDIAPPIVCHCNYPGSKFRSGHDTHGWRHAAPDQVQYNGMTPDDTANWDAVVQKLHQKHVPLVVEGSGYPGNMDSEIGYIRSILTSTAPGDHTHEDHRGQDTPQGCTAQ
jgi:sugar phosphate isomerase/epimerase